MPVGFPKKKPKAPRQPAGDRGRWVYVPEKELTPEQIADNLEADKDEVMSKIMAGGDDRYPFAKLDEFHDYFPGTNEVPEEGSWVMVKEPPSTQFTVPPLSIWFASPWPMYSGKHQIHRVKLITPKGELGLFPHEYVRVEDPGKYFEFLGDGMTIKFFGPEEGVPKDKLFYLRSRGISKKDAMALLIGSVMAHGVMWLETDENVVKQLGYEWPHPNRLATDGSLTPQTDGRRPEPAATGGSAERRPGDPVAAGASESLHGAHEQLEWGMGERTQGSGGTAGTTEVFKPFGPKQ